MRSSPAMVCNLLLSQRQSDEKQRLACKMNKSALSSLQTLDIQFFKINNNRATLQMALI